MAGFEETGFTDLAPEQMYTWVAERQGRLALARGMEVTPDPAATSALEVRPAETEGHVLVEPLTDRFPSVSKAVVLLARKTRYADFVPGNDRAALLGGTSATIDGATLRILEELIHTESTAEAEGVVQAEAVPPRRRLIGKVAHAVRSRIDEERAEEASKSDRIRREKALKDLRTLLLIHADDPSKAYEIFLSGQASDEALMISREFVAQYEGDPKGLLAALAAGKDLEPDQQRRLLQEEVGMELGDIRREMAERRRKGLGLDSVAAERYARYESQRAARHFDESGAIAAMDMRAERQAALAEAIERNKPDGKVLLVTDENLPTPGIVGPVLALFGAAEIHTAGVPYHQLTRDHLETVTSSYFADQLTYNDINQRYAIIVLQGSHPPIKPNELVHQIGDRDGDMAIIPGNIDQRFIAELTSILGDPYADAYGKFIIETRPSSQVAVHMPSFDNPMVEVRQIHERPAYLLVRTSQSEPTGN